METQGVVAYRIKNGLPSWHFKLLRDTQRDDATQCDAVTHPNMLEVIINVAKNLTII